MQLSPLRQLSNDEVFLHYLLVPVINLLMLTLMSQLLLLQHWRTGLLKMAISDRLTARTIQVKTKSESDPQLVISLLLKIVV